MQSDPTPADLIDLIEAAPSPERTRRLEALVASSPELARMVELMSADRRLLTSLEDPELPADLIAALEPMLARPVLVAEPFRPGALRRRRRRDERTRRLRRAALAAVWFIVVTAGALAVVAAAATSERWSTWVARIGLPTVAPAPEIDGGSDHQPPAPRVFDVEVVLAEDDPVHHHWRDPRAPARSDSGEEPLPLLAAPMPPRPLPFAVVVGGDAGAPMESVLASSLDGVPGACALVRNLTYEEARAIELQWLADASRQAEELPDVIAGIDGPADAADFRPLAERVKSRRAVAAEGGAGVLAGPRRLMPSWEQQLSFASYGASYTVAVPVAALPDLLAALHADLDPEARLRLLEAAAEGDPLAAVHERPSIMAILAELEATSPDQIVWVPVVVR